MLSQKNKGFLTIFSSCLLYLVIGCSYIWGNINLYIISYYGNVSSDVGAIVFPICGIVANIGILSSFFFVEKLGYRQTILFSSILLFGFIFACSFCPTFWSFFCCFGLGFGTSTGWIYLTILYNCYKYFPTKRGLIGGIVMGIYGLAPLISNYILLLMINPGNESAIKDPENGEYHFPAEIANKVPSSMRNLSYYFLGLLFIANILQFEFHETKKKEVDRTINNDILKQIDEVKEESLLESNIKSVLIKNNSLDIEKKDSLLNEKKHFDEDNNDCSDTQNLEKETMINENEISLINPSKNEEKTRNNLSNAKKSQQKRNEEWSKSSMDSHDERECFSLKDAAKSKAFYLIISLMYLSVCNGYFMAANFKGYGITKISDDRFLTLVGSISSLCNGGARFMWGLITDRFPFKKIYMVILIIQMIEIATLRFISEYSIAYLLWVSVALLCEGGHFVIFPPLCLHVFGPKVGSRVYSLLIFVTALSSVTQFGINLGLRPLIGYENEFLVYLGFTIVAFILNLKNDIKFKK